MGKPALGELFSPRGVAVVGASLSGGSFGTSIVQALKAAAFPAIYPVNPRYTQLLGLPCYPDLRAIPGPVDHVVVSIPAEAALTLLDDCAAKGVKSVHFFTAGFSETGEQARAELEQAVLAKARTGGFRIVGPNCVGFYVPKSRLTNELKASLRPGPIGFISQSGGHAFNFVNDGAYRGLYFSKGVSYGNALDVDEIELLDYLGRDPETEIIAAYIEGVRDGRRFFRVLQETSKRKPVVIYKGGTTVAGRRAARGHTASLTTWAAAFAALCRQAGAILVDDIDELMDVVVTLRFARPWPMGLGIALVGTGGGPSVLASDAMERAGLALPALPREVIADLNRLLPVAGGIFINPVDALTQSPELISQVMRALARTADVHMLMYHLGFHPASRWGSGRHSSKAFLDSLLKGFQETQEAVGKPLLLTLRPPEDQDGLKDFIAVRDAAVGAGFPVFYSLAQAGRALARVAAWRLERAS